MSISRLTTKHIIRHYREGYVSGASGGRVGTITELGNKKCTVNPDSDYESPEFGTRNEQLSASVYFYYDPGVRTGDFFEVLSIYENGGYKTLTNGPVYRVESVVDFQMHNRLWRVRAAKREALANA